METLEKNIKAAKKSMSSPRFKEITRLYSARQIAEQQGTIEQDYTIARTAAEGMYERLRELFAEKKSITTFGPYSPGQAVVMKRVGIEGIYLGGWATSAKGSMNEDPGADLASYPLSQVPDEAAPIVRALLTADKNQQFRRARMTEAERAADQVVDYRPFIIADADTGHGGDAHVRNLVRRFVEVGVPGYHIEDQKPGCKKCGHQGGKVLVPVDEQIKRLNAARMQLDVMRVPGIIVARTDAEAANLLDGKGDERDQPFLLGATNLEVPPWKAGYLAILKKFNALGVDGINGHLLYQIADSTYAEAEEWLTSRGIFELIEELAAAQKKDGTTPEVMLDQVANKYVEIWETESGLKTFGQAVAEAMTFHLDEGREFELSVDEWIAWSSTVSYKAALEKVQAMGVEITWDCELARTPEGYYPVKGGIEYAIAKSLAVAPFADIIWMETKTADLPYAKRFAEAMHAAYPEKMLAYNLSPSFNWDTTGMSEDEMRDFPAAIAKHGFVFNFITYGGHQVDGMASEEFATALKQDGMLSLARLQRKLRLVESPYKTPQSLVGGPRLDAALVASSGRTATTKAMGKGSTQVQHLIQTEVPPSLLEGWLEIWAKENGLSGPFRVQLRPHTAGSELLQLKVLNPTGDMVASVTFATIADRRGSHILSIRDQETHDKSLRKKRLMTLIQLFLFHRYKSNSVHFVSPTEDNEKQAAGMQTFGIYGNVKTEVGDIIVADVRTDTIEELLDANRTALENLIAKR